MRPSSIFSGVGGCKDFLLLKIHPNKKTKHLVFNLRI